MLRFVGLAAVAAVATTAGVAIASASTITKIRIMPPPAAAPS